MAIWMELRCERRGAGRVLEEYRCFSDDNHGPGALAHDEVQVNSVYKSLCKQAKESGWKRSYRDGGWICPNCIAYERSQEQPPQGGSSDGD